MNEIIKIDELKRHDRFAKLSGIYLLLDSADTVIYVGQSRNIEKRLLNHRKKPWAYFKYITSDDSSEMGQIESELIKQYQPFYNKTDTKAVLKQYNNRTNKKDRIAAEKQLAQKYGSRFNKLSCRQIQNLLFNEFGMTVSHATVNSDRKAI